MKRAVRTTSGLLAGTLLGFWGCASSPPPESSLPVLASVETRGSAVSRAKVDVPAATAPDEQSQTLSAPDPSSGAGTLLIYTAITGHQPFDPANPRAAPSAPGRWTASGEASRGKVLEAQIEQELQRQREVLDGIDAAPTGRSTIESLITGETLAERADPRIAPAAPEERELPRSLFDLERVTIMSGSWGNPEPIEVTRGTLDADDDGRIEQIRYFDPETDELLRVERDSNFDGDLDTWITYRDNRLAARVRDTNDDGSADVWEHYADDRMTERTIDRDRDGIADAFYRYSGGTLVEERHDLNNDGIVDRRITYRNLFRVSAEEDRDRDGEMDTWTTYGVSQGEEVVQRIEHASAGHGAPDVIETFDTSSGKSILAKREEDRNGDGSVDVVSYYKNGKLVQREISDPELAPL